MKYKVKNFDTSAELEIFLNKKKKKKNSILYVGPSKNGYTLIYTK